MQTPKRLSHFKKIPATAETDKIGFSRSDLKKSSIEKEGERSNYKFIKSFCKNLQLQGSYRQRLHTDIQPSKKIQESNDRKNILKYLDSKFSQCNDLKTWKAGKRQQILKPTVNISIKSKENLQYLFKEYMSAIRLLKIQIINEYNLGNILKQMKFVKNLLNQRDIITKLWLELSNPNIFKVFIFLAHLYLHMEYKHRQRGFKSYKGQYLSLMQTLFEEEGEKYNLLDLGKLYQSTQVISNNQIYQGFILNRQNRDTLSSFRRSISKNKL